jgi:predicted glycogen debranching enzyme
MEFGKAYWRTFEQGIQREWLLTNGIGGFASSTIIGANTRRYHGLLVASLRAPVSRHLLLSKIDESISFGNENFNLFSFQTADGFVMNGQHHLQRAIIDPLPTFIYSVRDIFIEKKISLVYGQNTVVILYHIVNGTDAAKIKLSPLVNFRDYHNNSSSEFLRFNQEPYSEGVRLSPANYELDLNIFCSSGVYKKQDNCYFYNMHYPAEQERGLYATEDHFIPGYFEIDIKPGEDKYITVIATIEDKIPSTDGQYLIELEKNRIGKLLDIAGYEDDFAKKLVQAADNFIVYRKSTNAKTVIAGYPWFTDWGRDTMIALPGLTLTTGRFDDAKEILYTFSQYVKDGLIPNMFPDEGQEPAYNSVDGALWYFEAVYKYIKYTNDFKFIADNIYSGMKEIISAFVKGTRFNIRLDKDFLLTAGDEGTQLTWMDAKVGDWVVTPRHGKAVEINALWYNALRIMSVLAGKLGEDGEYYDNIAKNTKDAFASSFWNNDAKCLYDVITGNLKDSKVRPNQIFAVSLSYPLIEGDQAKKIVDKVWKELYTAYGLRSLSPYSDEYRGIYVGDQYNRDGAYHQGTVWTWPLGHFITAFIKVYGTSDEVKNMAIRFIEPLKDHLDDACVGSISEIFDGYEPIVPRGCFAQAWSVAEILRAYIEDIGIK